jgi:hypothetical protein
LNLCGIVVAILKMATGKLFDVRNQFGTSYVVAILKMATGRSKFRDVCYGIKIQHCPISSKFDMWVDNDVPTLKNCYRSPFSKWPPQYRKNSTLSDIIKI